MTEQSTAVEVAQTTSENTSIEALIAQRIEKHSATDETEQEEPQETEETETEETEQAAEEQEETEESEETDEESEETEDEEIDLLLSKSPEEIQQLAKKGKSRLLQRIGELTAKSKALEEKLATQGTDAKPLPKAIPAEDNPFSNLKTVEEVKAKYDELEKVAEDTDRILEDHEDYGAEDIITLGGKEFTKKEIRLANRNARNAMLKFLPAHAAELERATQRTEMEKQYNAAIPVEIPELADAESPLAQQYQAIISDPLVEQVRQRVPELAPQLGYLLAHAVRSMHLKKPLKTNTATAPGITAKAKVPGSPVGAGAAKSGGTTGKDTAKRAAARFEETGSEEALIAARIARNSIR